MTEDNNEHPELHFWGSLDQDQQHAYMLRVGLPHFTSFVNTRHTKGGIDMEQV